MVFLLTSRLIIGQFLIKNIEIEYSKNMFHYIIIIVTFVYLV